MDGRRSLQTRDDNLDARCITFVGHFMVTETLPLCTRETCGGTVTFDVTPHSMCTYAREQVTVQICINALLARCAYSLKKHVYGPSTDRKMSLHIRYAGERTSLINLRASK